MVEFVDVPHCNNAPRRQVIKDLVSAVAEKQEARVRDIVADNVRWELMGDRTLNGVDQVCAWVAASSDIAMMRFNTIITHGKEGSADGEASLRDSESGGFIYFCHVLRFSGASKTAKVTHVRTFLIASSAE